jgi:hypothetical protein
MLETPLGQLTVVVFPSLLDVIVAPPLPPSPPQTYAMSSSCNKIIPLTPFLASFSISQEKFVFEVRLIRSETA